MSFFPISRLLELNIQTELINFVIPLHPSYQNSGVVTSQGDDAQKSNIVRESFRIVVNGEIVAVNGSGQKIGVLSDSYDTQPFTEKTKATVDVENGDLPGIGNLNGFIAPVEVLKEYPFGTASDEGRAMLQILHDVAPGAELAFHTGAISPRDFEVGINALASADCDIIVDDLTFITESFFGRGRIQDAIKNFTSTTGKTYFTSAGNFANNGYQSSFSPSTNTPTTNFLSTSDNIKAHVFGTNSDGSQDVLQKINVVPGVYMIVLQWDEGLASQQNSEGALTDLDIYLVDDFGNLIVGNNRFNTDGDPTEIIVFQSTGTGDANLLITNSSANTPQDLAFRYIAFQSNGLEFLEYAGAPTVSGHAMIPEAITVGAVDYRSSQNPQAQTFSSYGGTLANQSLIEVDIAAPDGGNTNVASIGQDIDGDTFPNFFGTSAAAPHAAGAFALLNSALASWYPNGLPIVAPPKVNPSTDKALQLFKQTALAAGNAETAGAGLINVENAFLQIATQTPNITQLFIEDGKTPSSEPFEVTILGEFLPENPTVIFDGEELEIISVNEFQIVALVNEFSGNPPLLVNATPQTPGGTDGGDSNPLFFFDDGKYALDIIANDISVEFGQAVAMTFIVEGLPQDVMYESTGLPEVKFNTPAVFPYPDVNNYNLQPYFEEELTEEQLASYQINFKPGLLTVTKKDLIVRPKDASYLYGEPIEIVFDYEYSSLGIEDNSNFLSIIQEGHQSSFFTTNTIALVNRFVPVVNEYDILNLLNEGSWMATERTIENRFVPVVNGMNFINVEMDDFTNYLDEINNSTTNRFIAVVNRFIAVVNGLALVNNQVDLSLENRFVPIVNDSNLGGEEDTNDYTSVFALVDVEDASTETEERTINKLYSLNMITGVGATTSQEDQHFIYPGAFLAPIAANFNITYDSGRLIILPATLEVETSDLLINQGEIPDPSLLNTTINGYVYDDVFETVFPEDLSYTFINELGEEYQVGDIGVFDIKISNPQNYLIEYTSQGKLYVNPYGTHMKKIRNYLDCIVYTPNDPSGFDYTAKFRYENTNDNTLYVIQGEHNNFSGNAQYSGELPYIFLPGEGSFEIAFDGNVLRWNLTTFESTHKTSTSAEANSTSTKCSGGIAEGDPSYTVFPNPVQSMLTIQQNVSEKSDVDIYNINGVLYYHNNFTKNGTKTLEIIMNSYPNGIYYVKIIAKNVEKLYTIIKE